MRSLKTSIILSFMAGMVALVTLSESCHHAPVSGLSGDILKPAGKAFLDSMCKAFSCAPLQYSVINRQFEGEEHHLLAVKVLGCSGDLSFDSLSKYINMPELISTRTYSELVSPEAFDQIQFSCESPNHKKTIFSIFSIKDQKLEYLQSYSETLH